MDHSVAVHFVGRSERVRTIYDTIVAIAREFGSVDEDPKKTSIHLNRKSAFAEIRTRREYLILTVKAIGDIDSERVAKSEQASANRWYHEIKLSLPDEIDAEIVGWLRSSYLISG